MDEPRRRISRLRLSVAGDDRAYVPVDLGDAGATPSTTRGVSVREEWASATTPLARSTATRRSSLVAGAGAPLSPRGAPLREEAPAYDGDKKAAQRSAARTRLLRTVAAAALLCVVVAVVGGIFAVHKRGGGAASADVHAPVSAQATLGGYALASFTPLASQAFVASVAAGAGVSSSDVAGEGGGKAEGTWRGQSDAPCYAHAEASYICSLLCVPLRSASHSSSSSSSSAVGARRRPLARTALVAPRRAAGRVAATGAAAAAAAAAAGR